MNKNINKSIVSSLAMLAVLALGVTIMPAKTLAQYGYVYESPYSSYGGTSRPAPAPAPVVRSSTVNSTKVAKAAPAKSTSTNETTDSSLAANAISASNSSLMSGIVQWILLAILILVIVILVRKIFGADKKYHSTPMKHA